MDEQYCALIIDLVKSKSYTIDIRNSIQHMMWKTISALNSLFHSSMLRSVDFNAGDEIQGLFVSAQSAYMYYRLFSMIMFPVKIRAGIGMGSWDVCLENKGTTGQDGRAYHNARHAIECTDENEGYPILLFSGNRKDAIINTVTGTAALLCDEQSIYQNQLLLLAELLAPVKVKGIENLYEMHNVNVNDILQMKNEFNHCMSIAEKALPLDKIQYGIEKHIMQFDQDDICEEQTFFVTHGKKRGLSTCLAELLQISRQSIDKSLRAGNVFIIRNMAITAISEMRYLS